ncbi:hypothetical protein SEPCBS119000_005919 [Sporothrix epigloea]|uniref:Uncharacterized protein n=1 Tax=Sporothrix epigloea TaxID=1892477 RepID=A0ABP0E058_9PEZI
MAVMKLGKAKPEAAKVFAADIPHEFKQPQDYIADVEERQRLFSKIRPFISETMQPLYVFERAAVSALYKSRIDQVAAPSQINLLRRVAENPPGVHNVESASARRQVCTLATVDIEGANGSIQPGRLTSRLLQFRLATPLGRPPVAHRESGLPLQIGYIVTIRAEDPEDLPSFDLLEMQWDLLRIAAMSGAAEAQDEWRKISSAGTYVLSNGPDADVEELDLYRTEEDTSETA